MEEHKDMTESLKDLVEHIAEIEAKLSERQEAEKRVNEGIGVFSGALDELINISGNMEDKESLRIVLNCLILKIAELNFRYHPITFIEEVSKAMRNFTDSKLVKIDRKNLPKDEEHGEDDQI